jgi:hypothetical protein
VAEAEKEKENALKSVKTSISDNVLDLIAPTNTSVSFANHPITLDLNARSDSEVQLEPAARMNSFPKASCIPSMSTDSVMSSFGAAGYSRGVLFAEEEEEEEEKLCDETQGFLPRYMRGIGWKSNVVASTSRTVAFTETDDPLPRPPAKEFKAVEVMKTISENPDLFRVPHVINVDRFEQLLSRHPNQPFVRSVMAGLRDGFWPWADTGFDAGYPTTWDNSWAPPPTECERNFIDEQRDIEFQKGRFSRTFGPDLLPGMYSTPVIAVPKPHSTDLRLVSNQSAGVYSQNSMVDRVQTKGARLDTMQQFIPALLHYRREHPYEQLVLWKSDVSEAYRLLPMHPLWQIKQVTTSNLPTKDELKLGLQTVDVKRSVDGCATFGNCGSPQIWFLVIGLVMWIAIFVKLIEFIFDFVDDAYGWELEQNTMFYKPYNKYLPKKQAQLLYLWDFLGFPHKERKQISGCTLTIIGFLINPNAMTITLPPDPKADLIHWVHEFIQTPSRRRNLHEFQVLTGWINWSFNVFPLLRPCLSNVYAKMRGKSKPYAGIYLNNAIKSDLSWFLSHLEQSSGVWLFEGMDWNPYTETDFTIFCDACLEGMGFWIPELRLGFYSPTPHNVSLKGLIFFFEALCVVSAIHWYCHTMRADRTLTRRLRLTVFTDNLNTVDIFDSLKASPPYNVLLRSAVDLLLAFDVDLRVRHVHGEDNAVADAISRHQFIRARLLVPHIFIQPFLPPRDALGEVSS